MPSLMTAGARRVALVGIVALVAYVAGVATGMLGSQSQSQPQSQPQSVVAASRGVLDEAADKILADAQHPVARKQLDQAAIEGMLKALGDRWSTYYAPADYASFQDGLEGRYSGIGVWLRLAQDGSIFLGSVQTDSPAFTVGLLAGDRVVSVDGVPATGLSLAEVASALRGPPHSKVQVEVSRDGSSLVVEVDRGDLAANDVVVSRLKGGVEVVRVAAFSRGVGAAVRKALAASPATDQQAPAGVVLDLRGNPGGLLLEAVEVASAFLNGGAVVSYEKRGEPSRELDAVGSGDATVPLVVLVDEGTASAAEVVAAALQDRNRAVIVGSHTFGKGSVQEPRTLSDGSAIELTVGRYLTPSGRALDGVGVEPDISVTSGASSVTAELRALEVLRGLVAATSSAQRG